MLRPKTIHLAGMVFLLASLVAGCGGGTAEAPSPATSNTLPPDVRGRTVMVLPVQAEVGVGGDADAELAFALTAVESGVNWVFRPRLEAAMERSPGLGARTTGLPVGMFLRAEVQRVGDPLYGDLRRLGALVDAEIALIPIIVAPGDAEQSGLVPLQTTATMIDVRSGRVIWFGVVAGNAGDTADPGVLASAMDRLARRLLWYVGG